MTARRITNNTSGIVTLPPDLGSIVLGPGRGIVTAFTEREIVEIVGGGDEFPRGLAIKQVPDQPGSNTKAAANDYFPSVLDRDLSTPPTTPAKSDRYLIASSGTGAWSGRDNQIAQWSGSVWLFTIPTKGAQTYAEDELKGLVFDGTSWDVSGDGPVDDENIPDPYTPPDGTWNVVGKVSVRASGGGANSEQFGANGVANGVNSIAVAGTIIGDDSTQIGNAGFVNGDKSTGIGANVSVSVDEGSALGRLAAVAANKGTALGTTAAVIATHVGAVAIGFASQTTATQRTTLGRVGGNSSQLQELQVSKGFAAFGGTPPSSQPAKISDPSGGATVDAEARTAIDSILDVLEGASLSAAA